MHVRVDEARNNDRAAEVVNGRLQAQRGQPRQLLRGQRVQHAQDLPAAEDDVLKNRL
jgi:hypothetical protein